MIQQKIIGLLLFGYTLFCNCHTEFLGSNTNRVEFEKNRKEFKVDAYARLPKGFYESSGLIGANGGTFWTLKDGGNAPFLYHFSPSGSIIDTLHLNLPNNDWESLAKDQEGNIYIGDFGNNLSRRQNLRIFKLHPISGRIDTLHFSYPEQENFPPALKEDRNFDCEAFFWYEGKLHLFSKSYGNKRVTHYVLPDVPGDYVARPVESIQLKGLITGASIRPDGQELALLSYGRIYLFRIEPGSGFFDSPYKCISLAGRAQTEAITYVGENLLLTNEQGRLIYVYKR